MALLKSISGIRGTIGGHQNENLTPVDIVKFTASYGQFLKKENAHPTVVIGRDARVSGEMVQRLVIGTLQGMGLNIVDVGLSTTPTTEIAVKEENAHGGIIITASHNPFEWNALKLLNHHGEFLSEADGKEVLNIAEGGKWNFAEASALGHYFSKEGYIKVHIEKILALPEVDVEAITKANFKIAVDGVNSTGGVAVPRLLRDLGVTKIETINHEPNGHFAHNPEPVPENLKELQNTVKSGNYDLGIAVDPDVDRLAFINEDGSPFGEEYTLVAVADYILSRKQGNTVSNMSSSQALQKVTESRGGAYFSSPVGEVNVVEAIKAHQAVIGGEGNGGVIYPGIHHGRDALTGIALFLTYLAKEKIKISELRKRFPTYVMIKDKMKLNPGLDMAKLLQNIKDAYNQYEVDDRDGVKIKKQDEWVHLRASNTEPIIRIIAESDTSEHAQKLIDEFKQQLEKMS